MHTIVIVSENEQVDEGLKKQLEMLFPDCRIKVLHQRADKPEAPSGIGWRTISTGTVRSKQ